MTDKALRPERAVSDMTPPRRGATPIILLIVTVAAMVCAGGWYRASTEIQESRRQLVTTTLEPLAALVAEDQALVSELQSEIVTQSDGGILAWYLANIRRDGVAKHANTKQRLDQLAENNTAIVTLIKAYGPRARTQAFKTAADKFRNYASAWRDRWNSVMELFMAGGGYAVSEVPFPKQLLEAVQTEIAAAK